MSLSQFLCTAIAEGNIASIEPLLNGDIVPTDRNLGDALHHAAWYGNTEAASILLAYGAQINESSVITAVTYKSLGVLQLFLDRGYELNSDEALLRFALDNEGVMRWLLERGADPNFHGSTGYCALDTAALKASTDTVLFLLDNGANMRQSCALHSAIERTGDRKRDIIPMINCLLDHGADIDALESQIPSTFFGRVHKLGLGTPLHKAVRKNNLEAVKLLIERGADTQKLNASGVSPAALAKRLGRMDIYELLVAGGLS